KTGGHLFPGIAVAQAISRMEPTSHVMFVGSGEAFETQTVTRYGFEHSRITSMGIKGKSMAGKLAALIQIPLSIIQAMAVIKNYRPDMVLGVGGYASGPVLVGAKILGIPTAIQEQNSIAGITNKILAPISDKIFTSFVSTLGIDDTRLLNVKKKIIHTGNPMRQPSLERSPEQPSLFERSPEQPSLFERSPEQPSLFERSSEQASLFERSPEQPSLFERSSEQPSLEKIQKQSGNERSLDKSIFVKKQEQYQEKAEKQACTILVTGGSQGAKSINDAVLDCVRNMLEAGKISCHIIHQTGALDENRVMEKYRKLSSSTRDNSIKITAGAFFHDLPRLMARADIIVCRAGAGTISEVTALGKPALLVPYPHAADDHQTFNAKALADKGAAWMVKDSELTGKYLFEKILFALNHPHEMEKMAAQSMKLGLPHADSAVARICIRMALKSMHEC
ncbi:MAG: undecaprenyldiphospho-muramoylpentapeptide beta-N-acetylglucosaminyltransferase, partial [Desulfamplus sp.]|nr:undecaprenyldiphospho-muramoylpentapeptide beta-N-acetylglucosaminyltransferase [Desulfamplus sp.]